MRFLFPCRRAARRVADCHLDGRIESRTRTASAKRTGTTIRSRMGAVGREARTDARRVTEHSDAAGTAETAFAPVCKPGPGDALKHWVGSPVMSSADC